MKSKVDPYQWTKNRITLLYREVKDWKDIEVTTQKHDIWSIKKLLALDYYVGPFVNIMRSKKFEKLSYVDPFSGSGILKLKKKYLFPGSPLIPLFRVARTPFHNYYLSDKNALYINSLKNQVSRMNKNINMQINKIPFSDLVENLSACNGYWKISD